MVIKVSKTFRVFERRACRVSGQARTTQRYTLKAKSEEERLIAEIVRLATRYGRYGYRRITALLNQESWRVNHKRVERIWRREGLKVPQRQPKRGRLWLNDIGVKTLFIERGSPWENGYIESFNGKLRDEMLNREVFTTLTEVSILTEVAQRVQSSKAAQCLKLPRTLS